jgi:hypothetical protein
MSDPETKPDQESSLAPPSSTDASPPQPNFTASFTLWPPTQRTRDAVINRLIETLSTSSVLSKRYGTMSADESSVAARKIEDEAFSVADAFSSSDNDSIKILEVYSKEISKRMIETVKARSSLVDDGNASAVTSSPAADAVAISDS